MYMSSELSFPDALISETLNTNKYKQEKSHA